MFERSSWRRGRWRLVPLGVLVVGLMLGLALTGSSLALPRGPEVVTRPASAITAIDATIGEPQPTAVVQTTHGPVQGLTVSADGYPTYQTFFGIRYGQDTGGDNRWLPPKPANWTQVLDATRPGPIAPQSLVNGEGIDDPNKMNEDCLRLNIWTPKADSGLRPVIVFIHGGGFTLGNPNRERYSGKRFAQDGVVYVDMSYRLGPWGFMDVGFLPGAPDAYKASGNLGLLDQRLALQFVHDNIAKFGGDPNRVTLAGGSAGGWSDTIHMALPESNTLFQRCISVSGSSQVGDVDWAKQVAQWTMEAAGVSTFAEMKNLTIEQLNDAQDEVYLRDWNWWCMLYRPIVDGITIKQDPRTSIRQGQGKNISLMIGSAADDMCYWLKFADWGTSSNWGPEATIPRVYDNVVNDGWRWNLVYERMVKHAIDATGKTPEQIEAAYMSNHPGATAHDAFMLLLTDLTFRIPAIRFAQDRVAAPRSLSNTWYYVDNWKSQLYFLPAAGGADDSKFGMCAGAFHEVGLGFAFGLPETWKYGPWPQFAPYVAGHEMQDGYGTTYPLVVWPSQLVPQYHNTWIQFAKTGNPNNPNIPTWPAYKPSTGRQTLLFDAAPSVSSDWNSGDRLLWESVPGDPLYDCPTDIALTL